MEPNFVGLDEEYLKEIEAFVKEKQTLTLNNGNIIKLKPLVWGQELRIIKIIGKLFAEFASNSSVAIENLGEIEIGSNIGVLLEKFPEAATEICSIITGLDIEDIENTFTFDDIVEVCFPFLVSLLKSMKDKVTSKVKVLTRKKT